MGFSTIHRFVEICSFFAALFHFITMLKRIVYQQDGKILPSHRADETWLWIFILHK